MLFGVTTLLTLAGVHLYRYGGLLPILFGLVFLEPLALVPASAGIMFAVPHPYTTRVFLYLVPKLAWGCVAVLGALLVLLGFRAIL